MTYTDMTISNSLTFCPSALREEADAILAMPESLPEGMEPALRWLLTEATEANLHLIAETAIWDDALWDAWRAAFYTAAQWVYDRRNAPVGVL